MELHWLLPDRLECTEWIQINLWWTYCLQQAAYIPDSMNAKTNKNLNFDQKNFSLKISLNGDDASFVLTLLLFFTLHCIVLRLFLLSFNIILQMPYFNEKFVFFFFLETKKRNKVYLLGQKWEKQSLLLDLKCNKEYYFQGKIHYHAIFRRWVRYIEIKWKKYANEVSLSFTRHWISKPNIEMKMNHKWLTLN